ncbi:MAG: hypothetical protein Q4A09_04255 [Capnocytophaga felis]|nr:hypothetical protein [Capnocytophaga felis]
MDLSIFKNKNFLFVMPNDFNLYEVFAHNLKNIGFNLIPLKPHSFKYKKKDKVINFVKKTFLGDRTYKQKLIKAYYSEHILNEIKSLKEKSVDYAFVIRPDLLSKSTLNHILKIGKNVVAYQWDGLERFPSVFDCISQFEKFYVFDPNDFEKYVKKYPNIKLNSNFYFDFDSNTLKEKEKNVIFYMGSYIENRVDDVIYAVEELEKYNIPLNVKLVYHRKTLPFINKNIQFLQEQMNFFDYLEQVKQAKILLDFKMKKHNGLSLRFFEALKYEKKIITNNASVVNYDFYNPNNIFILHKDNLADLESFLFSDYEKVAPEIIKKYAFSSWLYRCFFE